MSQYCSASRRSASRGVLLLLLAAHCTTLALASRCLPRCSADNVLSATVSKLRRHTDTDAVCHTRMRERAEALDTLRNTWLIFLGNSWTQAITMAFLQARHARAATCCVLFY